MVVKRTARAAAHPPGHLFRRGVLRLDPRTLVAIEDLWQPAHALGEVQPPASVVVDRHAGGRVRPRRGGSRFISIWGRLLAHCLSPLSISGTTRSRYSSTWRSMKLAMKGQKGITISPLARASSSATLASRLPRPMPS